MLLEVPLLVGPGVPPVPLTEPLRALAPGQVPSVGKTLQGPLNAAYGNLKTVFPLQLGGKVLCRKASPRATVGVKVSALGALAEDHGNPPKDARKEQRVEGVSQRLSGRHERVTRPKAGARG